MKTSASPPGYPSPEEFVVAALMSQATLTKLEWCGNILGVPPPSYYSFSKALKSIGKILERLAKLSMEENLHALPNKELFAMSDCGWNFRNGRSPMGTVTFVEVSTRRVIVPTKSGSK